MYPKQLQSLKTVAKFIRPNSNPDYRTYEEKIEDLKKRMHLSHGKGKRNRKKGK